MGIFLGVESGITDYIINWLNTPHAALKGDVMGIIFVGKKMRGVRAAVCAVLLCGVYTSGVWGQYATQNGMVAFEAEKYTTKTDRFGWGWEEVTTGFSNYTGTGAMQALPDSGRSYVNTYIDSSASLNYEIDFAEADTYFVHIKMAAPGGGGNSIHLGLDGDTLSVQGERVDTYASRDWHWRDSQRYGGRAWVVIQTGGTHTLNVWFREDGVAVDSLILTDNRSFSPGANRVQKPAVLRMSAPVSAAGAQYLWFDCMGRVQGRHLNAQPAKIESHNVRVAPGSARALLK